VYIHYTLKGIPFYVGKGKHKRAWSSEERNPFWAKVACKGFTVRILIDSLTGNDALELEELVIEMIGRRVINTGSLTNITAGGVGGWCVPPEKYNDWLCKIRNKLPRPLTEQEKINLSARMTANNPMKDKDTAIKNTDKKKKSYIVTNPNGVEQEIRGLKTWCRENGLRADCFFAILRGAFKTHQGWSIKYKVI